MTKSFSSVRRIGAFVLCACLAMAAMTAIFSVSGCDFGKKPAPTPAAPPPPVKVPKPISTAFVPAESLFVMAIDPEQFFTTSKLTMPERLEFKTLLNAETGVDLDKVEQVLLVGGLSPKGPTYGAILRYKAPIERQVLLQTISPVWEEASEGDKKYQRPKEGDAPCLFFADDKTLVIAPEPTLKQMLSTPADANSLILKRLPKLNDASAALAVFDVVKIRGLVLGYLVFNKLPAPFDKPPLSDVKNLLKDVDEAVVNFDVAPELKILATLHSPDEEAAKRTDALIAETLTNISAMLDEQSEADTSGPQNELAEIMIGQFNGIVRELTRAQKDDVVTLEFKGIVLENDINLMGPMAVSSYIKSWTASLAGRSKTNLQKIGAALDAYVAAKGSYPPPASRDANGKPLLSWRVHLLPMLGEQALYDEFHLDEPWDSAHNKTLIGRIPAVYRYPRSPAIGKTQLLLPTGPATLFVGIEGPKPETITDDKSKTIVLFETDLGKAVEWTKPADLVLDRADPIKGLQGYVTLPLNVLFADGSVGKFSFEKQAADLPSLLSPAAGDSDAPAAKTDEATKPASGAKPDGESKPASEAKPDGEAKAANDAKPDDEAKPVDPEPEGEAKPDADAKPDAKPES